jgi:hypothetical protein
LAFFPQPAKFEGFANCCSEILLRRPGPVATTDPGFRLIAHGESSLKTPKEEQDDNHYQDCPQKTTRGIAPTLAMRPGGKGADENKDEYDN